MLTILTDSTADLGSDIAAEFNLRVIPLSIFIGGRTYRDAGDIGPDDLFRLVKQTGELPKTSAPSVGEFENAFRKIDEGVYIGISSQLSATLQNARLAAQGLPAENVCVIDSLNLSTGIGLLALMASELQRQGCTREEIRDRVQRSIPKVRTSFVVETMEYLYKGGRCSAIQALMGSMLKIRPIIEVRPDGTMGVKAKARGSRAKALQVLLDELESQLPNLDRRRVFITHSGCPADAEFLAREVQRIAAPEDIRITLAGSVISSHCGPDTIGILYLLK